MSSPSPELLRLVEVATLDGISFEELSAVRRASPADSAENEFNPAFSLGIQISEPAAERTSFTLHLRLQAQLAEGELAVEPFALYSVPNDCRELVDKTVLTEYANEVGVMTLVPYLRQAVTDIAERVFEIRLVMPVVPRGGLRFAVPVDPAEAGPGEAEDL